MEVVSEGFTVDASVAALMVGALLSMYVSYNMNGPQTLSLINVESHVLI